MIEESPEVAVLEESINSRLRSDLVTESEYGQTLTSMGASSKKKKGKKKKKSGRKNKPTLPLPSLPVLEERNENSVSQFDG